ncbi:MAG: hypothetical protein GX345_08895 [Clostridiales bacterium]|nr:hypothetical protein [Clostridiales bacterium]
MGTKVKKQMTPAKLRLIKSAVSLVATTLVLVFVTVAWFSVGSLVTVDKIFGNVDEQTGFGYRILEAIDLNRNGVLDDGEDEDWQPVVENQIDLSNLAPNQKRFFKIEVTTGNLSGAKLFFGNVTLNGNGVPADEKAFLEKFSVSLEVKDGNDLLDDIASPLYTNLYELVGYPILASNIVVYSLDLSEYYNTSIDLFYTLGLKSEGPHTTFDEKDFELFVGNITLE